VIADQNSIWREPRPREVPQTSPLDWLLAAGFVVALLVEISSQPELKLRGPAFALALLMAPLLVWRRSQPLLSALGGWGIAGLLSVLQVATSGGESGPESMVAVVILLYSLVRWGSGREVLLGAGFVAVIAALGMYSSSVTWAEGIGGTLFLLLIIALAGVFRYRADLGQRRGLEIRNQERLELARELHDTVAHHVSAIAVQAQAGRVVASNDPEKLDEVLAAIESEASESLAEMRSIVRLLREDEAEVLPPRLGVRDLASLARQDDTLVVEVSLDGSMPRLSGSVESALYRIAQESLTNAQRHGRGVGRIEINLRSEGNLVRLMVLDDGQHGNERFGEPGFGLQGMAERAELLGGSLTAGPGPQGGWLVEARLPVEERA